MPVSFQTLSRFGPRHCGQSAARARIDGNEGQAQRSYLKKLSAIMFKVTPGVAARLRR
jgi:hypothetical protein